MAEKKTGQEKKEEKGLGRLLIERGIPLAVGFCASALTSNLIGHILPEPEKLTAKIIQKVGSYGIGLAVANAVENRVEVEAKAIVDIVEPLFKEIGEHAEPSVSQEEVEEIAERIRRNVNVSATVGKEDGNV